MKITLILIGETDDPHLAALMQDYEKRLRRVAQVQVVIRSNKKIKSSLPADMCRLEGELVLQAVEAQDQVILLDNNGQMYSSEGFAEFLQAKMNR